jgi:two-component system, NtrC family, sensor kinase
MRGIKKNTRIWPTFQSALLSEATRLRELEKQQIETQSKIRTYGFLAVLAVLSIVGFILYRNNRQKQKANLVLQEQKDKVESTLHELKSTQSQLIQSEKMASLGEN